MTLSYELFYIVTGAVGALLGANLLVASWASLYRQEWARVLILLGEPAAIVLILISGIATAVTQFGGTPTPGTTGFNAWELSHLFHDVLANLAYPILAISILRRQSAAEWFSAAAADESIMP